MWFGFFSTFLYTTGGRSIISYFFLLASTYLQSFMCMEAVITCFALFRLYRSKKEVLRSVGVTWKRTPTSVPVVLESNILANLYPLAFFVYFYLLKGILVVYSNMSLFFNNVFKIAMPYFLYIVKYFYIYQNILFYLGLVTFIWFLAQYLGLYLFIFLYFDYMISLHYNISIIYISKMYRFYIT